jgi:hypothetical protein
MRSLLLSFIIILSLHDFGQSTFIPVGRLDTDLLYEYSRELYLRGYGDPGASLFGRIDTRYLSALSLKAIRHENISLPLAVMAGRFDLDDNTVDFRLTTIPRGVYSEENKKAYWTFYPQLDYRLSKNILAQIAYNLDSRLAHDGNYMGKRWRSFAGFAETAVISYQGSNLWLDIGRRRNFWGIAPQGQSLMLSAQAMPLDGIFVGYRLCRQLSVHSIVAMLSPVREDRITQGLYNDNRYFSAHALRISPVNWLDIILKESVVYGGPGRRLEPYYAQPLLWFHAEQLNSGNDDNTFFGLETVWRFKNRLACYAELLMDDIQVERKTDSDREPKEYGLIIGADFFDLVIPSSSCEIEYARIANRTYNQLYPRNRYINLNRPIGYPSGPDNETFWFNYTHHFSRQALWGIWLYQIRQGEGKIDVPWSTPWIENPDFAEKFPSGVVRKESGAGLRFIYLKDARFQGKLTTVFADIKNDRNIFGNDRDLWSINCEIIFNLPNISWRLDHE